MTGSASESWYEANQRYLAVALAQVRVVLEGVARAGDESAGGGTGFTAPRRYGAMAKRMMKNARSCSRMSEKVSIQERRLPLLIAPLCGESLACSVCAGKCDDIGVLRLQ